MLVNLIGEDSSFVVPKTPSFSDVPVTHWAYRAVEYAKSKEVTSGIGNGKFGINDPVTYQQALAFLLKLLGHDFQWNQVFDTAVAQGIQHESHDWYINSSDPILRDDVFQIITRSLRAYTKSGGTLLDELVEKNIISNKSVAENLLSDLLDDPNYFGDMTEILDTSRLSNMIPTVNYDYTFGFFKNDYAAMIKPAYDKAFVSVTIDDLIGATYATNDKPLEIKFTESSFSVVEEIQYYHHVKIADNSGVYTNNIKASDKTTQTEIWTIKNIIVANELTKIDDQNSLCWIIDFTRKFTSSERKEESIKVMLYTKIGTSTVIKGFVTGDSIASFLTK